MVGSKCVIYVCRWNHANKLPRHVNCVRLVVPVLKLRKQTSDTKHALADQGGKGGLCKFAKLWLLKGFIELKGKKS